MSLKEHQNINEFLSGLSDENKRNQFTERLNSTKNKRVKEMKISTKHNFDAQTAWTKLHNRLNEDGLLESKKKKTISLNYISRIAASIILILGLSVSAYYIFRTDQYTEIASSGDIKNVYLPDGTKVTLNTNSVIRFPKEFDKKTREIEFEGEAFFEVKKMPEKPFVIKANDANVKVLGTSFNLNSREKNTELTVKTGKVQLSKQNNLSENIILLVGDKGSLIDNRLIKEKNSDVNYLSWKTKKFNYQNGITLGQVFSDLEKVYKKDIIINDDAINLKTINDYTFDNFELDTIFEIIFKVHHLKKEEKDNKIYIYEVE